MNKMQYVTSCVSAKANDIIEMVDDAREITLQTFARHVDVKEVSFMLGYDRQFPLSRDYHVRYFRSKYKGKRCYYVDHSSIEYVYQ